MLADTNPSLTADLSVAQSMERLLYLPVSGDHRPVGDNRPKIIFLGAVGGILLRFVGMRSLEMGHWPHNLDI